MLRQVTCVAASAGAALGPALLDHPDRLCGDAPIRASCTGRPTCSRRASNSPTKPIHTRALLFPAAPPHRRSRRLHRRAGRRRRFRVWLEHEDHCAYRVRGRPVDTCAAIPASPARSACARLAGGRRVPVPVRGFWRAGTRAAGISCRLHATCSDARPAEALDWDERCANACARWARMCCHQLAPFADARPECAQRHVARLQREPALL